MCRVTQIETNDPAEVAAKMAGDWWADLLNEKYKDRKQQLSDAITSRVKDELNGVRYWDWFGKKIEGNGDIVGECDIECDYEPVGLLASAVAEVFSDMQRWELFTAGQDLFPHKHQLLVSRERLRPKRGYGNWVRDIYVSCE